MTPRVSSVEVENICNPNITKDENLDGTIFKNKYSHVNTGTFFRKDAWQDDVMKLEFELPNDSQGPTFYNQGLVFSSRKRRCMIAVKRSLFTFSRLRHKTQVQFSVCVLQDS